MPIPLRTDFDAAALRRLAAPGAHACRPARPGGHGDGYLRRLLVHGARAIVGWRKRSVVHRTPWIEHLLERRPINVTTVAYANKLARIAWAIMMRGSQYDPARAFAAAV
jgi:transposase